jgi:TIR domain
VAEAERKSWDFFISYASENRESAADPLAEALTLRGFKVWLDHEVLFETSKLEDEIRRALADCHYGIVILSPRFLQKDWTMRELDTLLAIETLDGRHRVIPVVHNITEDDLREKAPELLRKVPISTAQGFDHVCDQILERVVRAVDRDQQGALGELGVIELPRFSARGILRCQNENCSWPVADDWPDFLKDAEPELTLAKLGAGWCIVCTSCRKPVCSVSLQEAKKIAAQVRIGNLWAPARGDSTKR